MSTPVLHIKLTCVTNIT